MALLHHEFLTRQASARPKILKLAREGKLIDTCFEEFQRLVYPSAPPHQLHMLRVAFFAGATELNSVIEYGVSTESEEPTTEDLEFWANVTNEIEGFHSDTIATSRTKTDGTKH